MEQSLAMAPSPYLFGLRNAAATYASTHAEPLGRHQRFALDFDTTTSTHTHNDSSEADEAWAGADFSRLRDPKAMHRFLAAGDYCFGYSNSDDEGTYDPTRECFHVGLGMLSIGDEDEGAGNRSLLHQGAGDATPPRVVPPAAQNRNLAPDNFDARTWNSSESFRPRLNKTDSFCSSSETLSSKSNGVAVMAERPGGGPATSTTASIMMKGTINPLSSIALAKTSQQWRCCSK